MPGDQGCPNDHVLEGFLLGTLSSSDLKSLARHVEQCDECVKVLHSLNPRDALVDTMQAPAVAEGVSTDPFTESLIAKLCSLLSLEDTPQTDGCGAAWHHFVGSTGGDAEELYDCLTASQAAGEIGRLGPYRVQQVLGSGGMGVVFRALDPHLQRSIALKTLRPILAASPSARRRFLREAQTAALITHDHIVTILHVGEEGGIPFLAMPLLPGETLDDRLKREEKLPLEEVLRYGRQIAEGLAAAHARQVIHRDIKPSNIWLEALPTEDAPAGESFRVKILDFGLARALDEDGNLTQSGLIAGTPAYMAPEQAQGEKTDARSDLFSLGCVLYRMATGKLPFRGMTVMAILRVLELERPTPPHVINPGLPAGFSDLVMRLLEKDRRNRPSSAQKVAQELAAIERAPTDPTALDAPAPLARAGTFATGPEPPPLFRGRRRWALAAGLLAGVLSLCFLVAPSCLQPGGEEDMAQKIDAREPSSKPAAWPIASLRKRKIPAFQLAIAGEGNPRQAPPTLVAVLGDGRLAHWDEVDGLAFSPDGQFLASASWDHTVKVWRRATGELLHTFTGHRDKVATLAISSRGLVASGSFDGTLLLWDLTSLKVRHTLKHGGLVHGVAFTKDGLTLASASWDGTATPWSVATGRPLKTIRTRQAWIQDVAFSRDDKTLATAGEDGTVRLYSVPLGQPLQTLARRQFPAECLDFSPDGRLLASGSLDGTVLVWELKTGMGPRTLSGHRRGISSVAFSPDGGLLVTSSNDGTMKLWNPSTWSATGVLRGQLRGDRSAVHGVAFSRDGLTLASGGHDGTIRLWDPTTGKNLLPRSGHRSWVNCLAFHPEGRLLASGSKDGTIRLWDLGTGQGVWTLKGHKGLVTSLDFSRDGRWMASGSADESARLWRTDSWKAQTLVGHESEVRSVVFAPNQHVLASASADHTIILWEAETGQRLDTLKGHLHDVNAVAFTGDGRLLASASADGLVKLWKTGEVGRDRGPTPSAPLRTLKGNTGGVEALAFRSQSMILASAGNNGVVKLWDAATAKELHSLTGHQRKVTSVTFSPDGKRLASAAQDGTVRLWDAATGNGCKVFSLGPPGGHIYQVLFSPDGRHLATANGNGTIYILRLS